MTARVVKHWSVGPVSWWRCAAMAPQSILARAVQENLRATLQHSSQRAEAAHSASLTEAPLKPQEVNPCDALNRGAKSWSNEHVPAVHQSRDGETGRFWASQTPLRKRTRVDPAQSFPLLTHRRANVFDETLSKAYELVKRIKVNTKSVKPKLAEGSRALVLEFQVVRQKALHLLRSTDCSSRFSSQFDDVSQRFTRCAEIAELHDLCLTPKCHEIERVLRQCASQTGATSEHPMPTNISYGRNDILTPLAANSRKTAGGWFQGTSRAKVVGKAEDIRPEGAGPAYVVAWRDMRFPQNLIAIKKTVRADELHRTGYGPGRELPPLPSPDVMAQRGDWRRRMKMMRTPPLSGPPRGQPGTLTSTKNVPKSTISVSVDVPKSTLINTRMQFYDINPKAWVATKDAWQNQFWT